MAYDSTDRNRASFGKRTRPVQQRFPLLGNGQQVTTALLLEYRVPILSFVVAMELDTAMEGSITFLTLKGDTSTETVVTVEKGKVTIDPISLPERSVLYVYFNSTKPANGPFSGYIDVQHNA